MNKLSKILEQEGLTRDEVTYKREMERLNLAADEIRMFLRRDLGLPARVKVDFKGIEINAGGNRYGIYFVPGRSSPEDNIAPARLVFMAGPPRDVPAKYAIVEKVKKPRGLGDVNFNDHEWSQFLGDEVMHKLEEELG